MSAIACDRVQEVHIPIGEDLWIDANLTVPAMAKGLILFAHGSGSGRLSPRNQYVAKELNAAHFGTLLADLLTSREARLDERTSRFRFHIPLLTRRLEQVIEWSLANRELSPLPIGLFGASTGAAAALDAAAAWPDVVRAVVSRGGRVDLASAIDRVVAPTLFIAGSHDAAVVNMNMDVMGQMKCFKRLEIVSGATHLFEESGALEQVAVLTGRWFNEYLRRHSLMSRTSSSGL